MKVLIVYYSMCVNVHRMAEAVQEGAVIGCRVKNELDASRFQGKHVAEIAAKLFN